MRNNTLKRTRAVSSGKQSEKFLMEKMGLSKKELREVSNHYGVTTDKLLELMMLSKYQFVFTGRAEGQCEPCHHLSTVRTMHF